MPSRNFSRPCLWFRVINWAKMVSKTNTFILISLKQIRQQYQNSISSLTKLLFYIYISLEQSFILIWWWSCFIMLMCTLVSEYNNELIYWKLYIPIWHEMSIKVKYRNDWPIVVQTVQTPRAIIQIPHWMKCQRSTNLSFIHCWWHKKCWCLRKSQLLANRLLPFEMYLPK